MTQSIIVYRNPMEQAFWESGMLIPLAGGCVVGLILFGIAYKLSGFIFTRFRNKLSWSKRNYFATNIAAIVGVCSGLLTTIHLYI